MAFDLNRLELKPTLSAMETVLKAAYEQGRSDAIASILAAAQDPEAAAKATRPSLASEGRNGVRAQRGAVPVAIDRMLTERPGLSIQEYEAMLSQYDSQISTRSVGNELRRFEGKKYRRDRHNWYPIAETNNGPDNTPKATSDPLSVRSNQGGLNGTALI